MKEKYFVKIGCTHTGIPQLIYFNILWVEKVLIAELLFYIMLLLHSIIYILYTPFTPLFILTTSLILQIQINTKYKSSNNYDVFSGVKLPSSI